MLLNNNQDINTVIKLNKIGKKDGFIQIYNLDKEKIKEIKNDNTKDVTSFLDSYYNKNI